MARKGNLYVISGPSGAGKGTLVARVLERVPDAWVSVSATTRKPRPGEQDGVHYLFLSDEEFDRIAAADGFLEWADVHTARYGTPLASVREHMAAGDQVILEIDVQGAFQVKEKLPECHLIFIDVPSRKELLRRLRERGTEAEDVIAARMRVADMELSLKSQYDYTVVNDDIERATAELAGYIQRQAEE
ncbi:guanylate kinase [Curtanaerobium respiraculi]|uniref:guanylate kinase n=1 Tax=Curtanaerobium respiraculi TaxID=2949669 RepID=UPI0024B37AC6|nr:guanylate kinase [Curtanaerobium respiraculi]